MESSTPASASIRDRLKAAYGGRQALVLGLGLSNNPVVDQLVLAGADVTAADRKTREQFGASYANLTRYPIRLVLGPDYLRAIEGQEVIFLTPGIRRDLPEIEAARRRGVPMSSEMRLFFELCPAPVVGITGSAGKTTTTTLVGLMLQAARGGVWVGGNIGRPLLGEAEHMAPGDLAVVELSSFQLQDMGQSPQVAAVLNVSPNHLDMHPSMEHYIAAKKNIYLHQEAGGAAVFGFDNQVTREMAAEYGAGVSKRCGGRGPVLFGRRQSDGCAAFVNGEELVLDLASRQADLPTDVICRRQDLQLLGEHNVDNVLAAATIAGLAGAGLEAIRGVATTFTGVEHRLEPVGEVEGVRYYNDSIATAPDRTIAALRALPAPLVLILGGYDKRIGFDGLAHEILRSGKVRAVVLTGDTAPQIRAALERAAGELSRQATPATPFAPPELVAADGFAAAVAAARRVARPGDAVALSPACASYDSFANFEERGRTFKQLVAGLSGGPIS